VSTATDDLARLLEEVDDLRAQVARLAGHPVEEQDPPTLDAFGVLTYGNGWVPLSPLEETIVRRLLDSFGTTVARDDLIAEAWPDGGRGPRALDTKIHRLRNRLAPLGLAIHTVRRRGFVLDARPTAEEPTWPIS
jgi:DNA-binding response OmpR family regulator